MRLEIGDLVKTSYGSGPYRIVEITRGCRCAPFTYEINHMGNELPEFPEHMHLVVEFDAPDGVTRGPFWLNQYDDSLTSIGAANWDGSVDYLIACVGAAGIQETLF